MIFFTDDDPEEWRPAMLYLPPLAMHVLPEPERFEAWMFACAERLVNLYPAPADDPFDDLFGERCHERRGPLVAREALDPQYNYRPETAERLIDDFLRSVDFVNNPFLNSPLQMREDGIEGAPYAR
jgi:hypothetical protein